jgi:hypothetical protein
MMKRTLLIVAILALSVAPAMATVTISAIQTVPSAANGAYSTSAGRPCNAIDINYICGAGESVRAFALEVTLDNGFTFTSVADYNKGESKIVAGDANYKLGYGIFPGKFRDVITPANPVWTDGNYMPIAPNTDADATGTGIGTNKVIIEAGSLYVGASNKPPSVGRLCRLYVMPPRVPLDCNITLALNTTRGGVVLEDGTAATTSLVARGLVAAGKISFPECFPCWGATETQYAQFLTVWKPNCWCGRYAATDPNGLRTYQCYGDTDGKVETLSKFRVYTSDYNRLVAVWKNTATQLRPKLNGFCADFDHQAETLSKFRVYTSDYNKLVANWKKTDTQLKSAPCPQ